MKQTSLSITPRVIPGCSVSKFAHVPIQADLTSYIDHFNKRLCEDIQNERLMQVQERLLEMGHAFNDKYMLQEFITQKATIVTQPCEPDYRVMYLFYGTKDQVTVGGWWETYEVIQNFDNPERGFTMTIIVGKEPKH
jgi:hypothetical protein